MLNLKSCPLTRYHKLNFHFNITAYATRTDLKATALLIEAKGKQLGWERSKIISFIAFLNARNEEDGLALGPAFSLGIPIFNWNRGKILRTRSEMEQATWQYLDVKRNITLEVNQAYAEWKAGRLKYELWEQNELSLANVTEQVQKAYEAGEVSYYFYLETLRRVIDIQLRAADARAAIYRATANLNYSIGKKQL